MAVLTYSNFDLEVEQTREGYQVRVSSDEGHDRQDLESPFVGLDIEQFLSRIGRSNRSLRDLYSAQPSDTVLKDTLRTFGTSLFQGLFAGRVAEMYRASLATARASGKGLRIRLHLTGAPELAQWPWEFLFDPSENDFVTRSARFPLVRYLEVRQPIQALAVRLPLTILVIIARPPELPDLDVEAEWQALKDALKGLEDQGRAVLHRLEQATVPALLRKLRQEDYHIVHFVGHGDFDTIRQEGILLMEGDNSQGRPLGTEELRTLLRDERQTVRLVVLNACKGARSRGGDPFAGLAQGLIQMGIPCVIAMQFAISDEAAITFAQAFYASVADGYPIDAALGEARKAIFVPPKKPQFNELEWGIPVLFMRSPDGQIFELPATPPARDIVQPVAVGPSPAVAYTLDNKRIENWFVNRKKQHGLFLKMLGQDLQKQIMLVEAPPGMGKSWLVNKLHGECSKQQVRVSHFNLEQLAHASLDYLGIVREARNQLGARYFNAMTEFINANTSGGVRQAGQVVGDVVQDNLGLIRVDSEQVRQQIRGRILGLFFECLRAIPQGRVVFLLDAYENVQPGTQEWVEGELLPRICHSELPNVLVVVAGRQVPRLDLPEWEVFVVPPPPKLTDLEPFLPDDVAEYLERRGATTLDLESVVATSGGIPRKLADEVEMALLVS